MMAPTEKQRKYLEVVRPKQPPRPPDPQTQAVIDKQLAQHRGCCGDPGVT